MSDEMMTGMIVRPFLPVVFSTCFYCNVSPGMTETHSKLSYLHVPPPIASNLGHIGNFVLMILFSLLLFLYERPRVSLNYIVSLF
jgi:hypothetical protein